MLQINRWGRSRHPVLSNKVPSGGCDVSLFTVDVQGDYPIGSGNLISRSFNLILILPNSQGARKPIC